MSQEIHLFWGKEVEDEGNKSQNIAGTDFAFL